MKHQKDESQFRTRPLVHTPEGEVGDGSGASIGLGHNARRTDLNTQKMLNDGEGEHHHVTLLAHL